MQEYMEFARDLLILVIPAIGLLAVWISILMCAGFLIVSIWRKLF